MYPNTPEELGLLIGGMIGTLPALAVLSLALLWCYVNLECCWDTNRSSRTEARAVGRRPKIHEALIDEHAACCDDGCLLVWRKTLVRRFTY
jgi:hypothetical protein